MRFISIILACLVLSCGVQLCPNDITKSHVQIAYQKNSTSPIRGIGSGTVISSHDGVTYVLTAHHVMDQKGMYYVKEDVISNAIPIINKVMHSEVDLAIVEYRGSKRILDYSTDYTDDSIWLGDFVTFVGAPRGVHQEVSAGNIDLKVSNDAVSYRSGDAYRVDFPCRPGYSGGGVYRGNTLIGIVTGYFYINVGGTIIPESCIIVGLSSDEGWVSDTIESEMDRIAARRPAMGSNPVIRSGLRSEYKMPHNANYADLWPYMD